MNTAIQDWIQRIDAVTQEFKERFADLNADELNRKPDPGSWSIAENLQHLITVNESYFPVFTKLQEGSYKPPFIARISFLVNAMGKMILKSVEPSRQKKLKTFAIWEPVQGGINGDILNRFSRHQAALKDWILKLEGNIGQGSIIASPANQSIVYKLGTAIDIIVTHEQRHLNQSIEAFDIIFENQYDLDV
jgi:hypothetical protein